MNTYLRLLLIGTILCVVLGVYQEESGERFSQSPGSGAIEHVASQAGLLPVMANDPPAPECFRILLNHRHAFISHPWHSEQFVSSRIAIRIFKHRMDFEERKPEIYSATGQFLQITGSRNYPA